MSIKRIIWSVMATVWLLGSVGFIMSAGRDILRELESRLGIVESKTKELEKNQDRHESVGAHRDADARLGALEKNLEIAKLEARTERNELRALAQANRSILIFVGLAVYTNLTGILLFLGRWLFFRWADRKESR